MVSFLSKTFIGFLNVFSLVLDSMKEIMSVVKAPLAFPRSIGGQGDDFQRQTNLLKLTQEVLEDESLQNVERVSSVIVEIKGHIL